MAIAQTKLQRLMEQRKKTDARIRQELLRQSATERKRDTRRKVLAGALALEWAAQDAEFAARFYDKLGRFLVKDVDRALFELAPLSSDKPA